MKSYPARASTLISSSSEDLYIRPIVTTADKSTQTYIPKLSMLNKHIKICICPVLPPLTVYPVSVGVADKVVTSGKAQQSDIQFFRQLYRQGGRSRHR